jgi:hypothetical protein
MKISKSNLENALVTYNADPFLAFDDEQIDELWEDIMKYGAERINFKNVNYVDYAARLDLPEDTSRIIYKVGNEALFSMEGDEYTFDLVFSDSKSDNEKGWNISYKDCMDYIEARNGTDESYFADYKGGTVSIFCHETEEIVYTESIAD